MMRNNIGITIMRLIIAIVEPMMVSCIAFWPSPWRRYLWPGSREIAVSSDAAPRYVDGMKSINVWVIAKETM